MQNETKNSNSEYLKKLEKHAEHLRLVRYYSIQRIDLLIISLSSAGIFVCFEVLKYIDSHTLFAKHPEVTEPFKFCGILFTSAIVANFISQWTAYKGSGHALESTKVDIYAIENSLDQTKESERQESLSNIYNKVTEVANLTSNGFMIVGLITLIVSYLHLF